MAELTSTILLRGCLRAFNEIPNRKLSGIPDVKNTYDLCAAIENLLAIEESNKLHEWLSGKAAQFYVYESIIDDVYKKFSHTTISHLVTNYGHGFKSLREVYTDILGRNE